MDKNNEIKIHWVLPDEDEYQETLLEKEFRKIGLSLIHESSKNEKFDKRVIVDFNAFKSYMIKLANEIKENGITKYQLAFGILDKNSINILMKEYETAHKEHVDAAIVIDDTEFIKAAKDEYAQVKNIAEEIRNIVKNVEKNQETKEKYLSYCKVEIAHACKLKKCFWDKDYTKEQIIKNIPHNALTGEPYMKTESAFLLNHKEKNGFKEAIYLTIKEAKEISPSAELKEKSYGIKVLQTDIQSQEIHVSYKTLFNIEQFSGIDKSKIAPKNLESIEKFQESAKDANLNFPLINRIGLFERTANDIKRYLEAQVKGLDFAQSKKFAPQEKIAQKYQNNYQKDKSYTNPKTQYHRDRWKAKNSSGREF